MPAKPASKPRFNAKEKEFFKTVKDLLELSSKALTDELTARIKSVVCMGRELLTDPSIGEHSQVVWDEIDLLRSACVSSGDSIFFGFQTSRSPTTKAWQDAAIAYSFLATAIRAEEILQDEGAALTPYTKRSLLYAAAASETYLYRVLHEHNLWAFDPQQVELHQRLRTEGERQGHFVPIWKSVEEGGMEDAAVLAVAENLPGLLKEAVEGPARDKRKQQALHAVQHLIAAPYYGDFDFEEELVRRALACLEAGIPPTKKELTSMLMPYLSVIAESEEPKLKRFLEAIRAEASLAARKQTTVQIADDRPIDPETALCLKELQGLLSGKVVLFVGGGNKGDRGKREVIKNALQLKELIWPDCEESTPIARFDADVARADLVCKAVLSARTGHTAVIKKAMGQGKMGAYLTKGLGLYMVVHDLHLQLIARHRQRPIIVSFGGNQN